MSKSNRELVCEALDRLAKEHGQETFVTDGYGYYEDAQHEFIPMLKATYERGFADGHKCCEKRIEKLEADTTRNDTCVCNVELTPGASVTCPHGITHTLTTQDDKQGGRT